MSKTGNLVVFFLLAFVFNIVVFLVLIVVIVVADQLILGPNANPNVYMAILFVGFLGSLVATFFIYGWVVQIANKRLNLQEHIPQLFKKRK